MPVFNKLQDGPKSVYRPRGDKGRCAHSLTEEKSLVKLSRILFTFLIAGASAFATSVTFTFDSQTINGTSITGLSSGATAAQIQTYMNQVLTAAGCTGCSVTVVSSGSMGAVADRSYNGEGYVTGPGSGTTSLTLGNSDGATASNSNSTVNGSYDTFISNTTDGSSQIAQQITLQFSHITGLTINSFDYEIFPDGSCPSLSNCGSYNSSTGHYANQPDLVFQAGNNNTGSDPVVNTFWGVVPGTTDGNSVLSPNHHGKNTEAAPQAIGTWSGSLTNVSELNFVDWPATIGIDNLNISFTTGTGNGNQGTVPEPVSIVLLGTIAGGLLLKKKWGTA